MSLTGQLETVSLAGILQLLCDENKSGILKVSNDTEEFQLCYMDGSIIYAVEPKKKSRLGTLLMQDGLITRDEVEKSLVQSKKEKKALGKILVESGLVTIEILEKYVYRQVEEIIYNLFTWKKGNFQYMDAQIKLSWLMVVKLNTLQLVMDASRRLDEARPKEEVQP